MVWSEPEPVCKIHPDHKQPAGVCSCCLRERLSKINGAVMVTSDSVYPTAAADNYSSASSSCSSGGVSPRGHRRITSDVAGRFSFITIGGGGDDGLKKSRSIAFVARRSAAARLHGGGGKKKEGFWSKLIKSTGKKTKKSSLHPATQTTIV